MPWSTQNCGFAHCGLARFAVQNAAVSHFRAVAALVFTQRQQLTRIPDPPEVSIDLRMEVLVGDLGEELFQDYFLPSIWHGNNRALGEVRCQHRVVKNSE